MLRWSSLCLLMLFFLKNDVSFFFFFSFCFCPDYNTNSSPRGLGVQMLILKAGEMNTGRCSMQPPHTGSPLHRPQPIVSLFCLVSFSKCGSWWLKCKLQYTAGRKRNLVVMVAGGMGAGSPTIKPGSCPPALFTATIRA